MKPGKLIALALVAALGCSTSEMARRAEIEKVESQVRDAIRRLVDEEKFLEACQYRPPKYDKPYLADAAERTRASEIQDWVCPKWVEWNEARISKSVGALVGERKFGEAREFIWQYGNTGFADVDVQVDAVRYRILSEKVNVAELEFMNREMTEACEKAIAGNDVAALVEAKRKISGYPAVRTYSSALDDSLNRVRDELVAVKVPKMKLEMIILQTKSMIADCFIDRKANVKEAEGPDLTGSRTRLSEFESDLIKYGCNAQQAKRVAGQFERSVKPLLDDAVNKAKGGPNVVALGTSSVNTRAEEIRKKLISRIDARASALLRDEFISKVESGLKASNPDFKALRLLALAPHVTGDVDIDAQFLAVRIGILNTMINPAQFRAESDAMRAVVADLEKNAGRKKFEDYERANEQLKKMRPVDDDQAYAGLFDSLQSIGKAMKELKIPADSVDQFISKRVADLKSRLEQRANGYADGHARDETAYRNFLKSLNQYGEKILQHFTKEYAGMDDLRKDSLRKGDILNDVSVVLDRGVRPMTTEEMNQKRWELNWELRRQLMPQLEKKRTEELRELDDEIGDERMKNYKRRMNEFELEKQIKTALHQIAVQCGSNPRGGDGLNALLGEYVRINRLINRQDGEERTNVQKDPENVATLIAGAIYLGEERNFNALLDAATDDEQVNRPSPCDPLGRTPVMLAIEFARDGMLARLKEKRPDYAALDLGGNSVMHYVAKAGNTALIDLFKERVDVAGTNFVGETALFVAARQDDVKMIDDLIAAVQDRNAVSEFINHENRHGVTAFVVACSNGCLSAVGAFLRHRVPVDGRSLAAAVAAEQLQVVRYLVERGASVNWNGVMAAAPSGSKVEDYLVSQGGVRVIRPVDEKGARMRPVGKAKFVLCEVDEDAAEVKAKEGTSK